MPGPSLTTDALVIGKRPPSDAFQTLTAFSPTHGALRLIQRLPHKPSAANPPLDLFDDVSLLLEATPTGDAYFVKEPRLLVRHAGIALRYEALVRASAFATLVARNPVPEESREAVHALLRTAFAAFATSAHPDIVYLKSLYCFARDEGYPVKQHWFPALPADHREAAAALLRTPLAQIDPTPLAPQLLRHLESYLRQHTELTLD